MLNTQHDLYKITLALAGIMQSITLVRELAHTGKLNDDAYQSSIYSIFQTTPQDIASIYKEKEGLKIGLIHLIQLLGPRANESKSLTRYALSLIHLQKKIWRRTPLLEQLIQRINQIKKQADYFHLTHATVISNLADAYLAAITPFRFRIIIRGTQRSLSAPENMNKIRALLLAGLRAAVLWRQVGGSRWQLLFWRSKIKATAEKILMELEQSRE